MKPTNFVMPAAEPEQDNLARPEGRGDVPECGGEGLAAAIREVETLEAAAHAEELLRRSASVASAMMLQDTIVTVLTLLLELERLMPSPPDRSAFDEFAGRLAKAAINEVEQESPDILDPPMGHA